MPLPSRAAPVPTVLLADDNPRIHGLVARILGDEFQMLDGAADGEELIETALRLMPDVLVVDIGMPRLNGIEAVKRLSSWRPAAVVFLTSHGETSLVEQAMAAGGLGYVLKESAVEDLALAIRAALRSECYVSPSLK